MGPPPPPPLPHADQNSSEALAGHFPPPPGPPLPSAGNKNVCIVGSIQSKHRHFKTEKTSQDKQLTKILGFIDLELGSHDDSQVDGEAGYAGFFVYQSTTCVFIQQGPTCGLVALESALWMIRDSANGRHPRTLENYAGVFDVAVRSGYTKQGEMFSVDAMSDLVQQIDCHLQQKIIKISDPDSWKTIITAILNGFLILFPYDADKNHGPALRAGHAAHWAVIHGLLVLGTMTATSSLNDVPHRKIKTAAGTRVAQVLPDQSSKLDVTAIYKAGVENIHLLGHQGKSAHLGIWSLKQMINSNLNLNEISPKILESGSNFVIHEITSTLCGQAVCIKSASI